jgi:hypothetical protein
MKSLAAAAAIWIFLFAPSLSKHLEAFGSRIKTTAENQAELGATLGEENGFRRSENKWQEKGISICFPKHFIVYFCNALARCAVER